MKPTNILIIELRNEYLELKRKISKAEFAVKTLPFDKDEVSLINDQIWNMERYAAMILNRAEYAKKKEAADDK
jgi:hypothetical protein